MGPQSCDASPMGLTISHTSALEALRAIRVTAGKEGLSPTMTGLVSPHVEGGSTWSPALVAKTKRDLGLPAHKPLDVLVPDALRRIHTPSVANHIWSTEISGLWFWELGTTGIVMPGPEVLLAQMAEVMGSAELIALGHELCGRYTLRPSSSLDTSAVTGIPPVTSEEQIRKLAKEANRLRGRVMLRFAIPRIRDGSLSPQETCLSTIVQLPVDRFGYQLGKVDLNVTLSPPRGSEGLTVASHRVPDLLFRGTNVGLNYDGDVHVDLEAIVRAAKASVQDPKSSNARQGFERAIRAARDAVARDKQRDRDLAAIGYTVPALTKLDLESVEALDQVMLQVITLIERNTGRDMALQREALNDERLKRGRGELLRLLRNL